MAEEKGSDVNLAADLVHDACTRTPDLAVVISNDSDLQRAVHLAMRCGVTVYTVNPHRSGSQRPKLFGSGSLNTQAVASGTKSAATGRDRPQRQVVASATRMVELIRKRRSPLAGLRAHPRRSAVGQV